MKTKITLLTLLTGLSTWVLAQTTPPGGNRSGSQPVQPSIGVPTPNQNGQNRTIPPQNKVQVKGAIPSPNDDEINQMTPDITNYVNPPNGYSSNLRSNHLRPGYESNWNGSHPTNRDDRYFRTNGMPPPFGKTNRWSNGRTNWPGLPTNNWPDLRTNGRPKVPR